MSLQNQIYEEIKSLSPSYQKEILDFVLFIKRNIAQESDTEYLSKNPEIRQAIIDGLNTPLSECVEELDW